MGYYIDPPDMTKEAFLLEHGRPIHSDCAIDFWKNPELVTNDLPVCFVHNGNFTAAGIAYSLEETLVFLGNVNDKRPKLWFIVSREKLSPYYQKKEK